MTAYASVSMLTFSKLNATSSLAGSAWKAGCGMLRLRRIMFEGRSTGTKKLLSPCQMTWATGLLPTSARGRLRATPPPGHRSHDDFSCLLFHAQRRTDVPHVLLDLILIGVAVGEAGRRRHTSIVQTRSGNASRKAFTLRLTASAPWPIPGAT